MLGGVTEEGVLGARKRHVTQSRDLALEHWLVLNYAV